MEESLTEQVLAGECVQETPARPMRELGFEPGVLTTETTALSTLTERWGRGQGAPGEVDGLGTALGEVGWSLCISLGEPRA